MLHKSSSVHWLVCFLMVSFLGVITTDAICQGYQVQPVCEDDLICSFEGGFCGTTSGDVSSCAGPSGLGACINGGYIVFGDMDFYSNEILGFECQVIFDALPGTGDHASGLITKYMNHFPTQSEWGLFVEGNLFTEPRWMLTGDGTNALYSSCVVEPGVYYHVQVMICGDMAGVWVNESLVASGSINRNGANTATNVVVGNTDSHGNYFYGKIDEVRIGCTHVSCTISNEESSWGQIKSIAK